MINNYNFIFPLGIFIVNLIGSFFIGLFYSFQDNINLSSELKTALIVGFLGALTTYSSFSLDIVKLIEKGFFKYAFFYWMCTNIFCISGCYLGFVLMKK